MEFSECFQSLGKQESEDQSNDFLLPTCPPRPRRWRGLPEQISQRRTAESLFDTFRQIIKISFNTLSQM